MNKQTGLFWVALTAGLGMLTTTLSVNAQETDENVLEEITVTAQRREESLQTVPLSVSAFTEVEMDRRQINTTLDIIRQVPNLVGSNNVGLGSATSLFMRGVGQDESLTTHDPAVGTYVDGVYIARQISNNAFLYDIERVEVLRGPQGTLYGRNTSGGAIKIVTRKPSADFLSKAEASYGSWDSFALKGMVNVPFSEKVFFSATAFTAQRDKGFQRNVTTGERTFDASSSGVRASLRALPNDNWDIVVTAEYAEQSDSGITGSNFLGPNPDDLFEVQSGLEDPFNEIKQFALTANITWDAGNSIWHSITGYRDLDHDFRIDFSDGPVPNFVIDQDGTHKQFSQEFQGSGSVGKLNWVAGVFYMDETNDNVRIDELFGSTFNFLSDFENDATSYAVYAQGSYSITEKLSFTLGGRWSHEKKTIDFTQLIGFGGGLFFPFWGNGEIDALGVDRAPVFEDFTPKIGFEYQFNDTMMGYASYTEGFKSGGWDARVTAPVDFTLIDAETAKAYEIGLKTEFADNRVRLNSTYFHNTYEDFIITALDPLTGGFVTINAAEAKISGLEFELSARPAAGLDVYANLGIMWNKYTKLEPVLFDINNEIKRTPELNGQIGFNYRRPLSSSPGSSLIFSADYSHQDEYFAGVQNTPPELSAATNLIYAAISYEHNDGRWMVTLACENCTDDEFHTSTLDFGVLGFATQFPGERRVTYVKLNFMYN